MTSSTDNPATAGEEQYRPVPAGGRPGTPGMMAAAVLVGLGSGAAAVLFRLLIQGTSWLFTGARSAGGPLGVALPAWWILVMPALGGGLVGLLATWLAPETRGTGVPEVMEAVALRGGRIRRRVAVVKSLVVALCLGSGGSAGREGPIIHVGSALGSLVAGLLRWPLSLRRTLVGCGAAAGIAATFNAPIAGAMFAGEVILGQFGVVSFAAIVIASVSGTVLARHFIGDFPAFSVPAFHLQHTYELFFHALLGLAAALAGVAFIRALGLSSRSFERLRLPPALKPALGGLAVGAIGVALPQVLGVGYQAINLALLADGWKPLLLLWLLGKLLATSLTLGSGGSGGAFAPSLFMGAMLGAAGGGALGRLLPGVVAGPGSYALVAMAACAAATTRAPITAILIVFEMTNNYTIILPVMLACILATLLAGALAPASVYHLKLLRRGVDLSRRRDVNLLRGESAAGLVGPRLPEIPERMPLDAILDLAVETGERYYLVVDDQGRYRGLLRLQQLLPGFSRRRELGPLLVAADLVDRDIPPVSASDSLDTILRLMDDRDVDVLAVVDDQGRPQGRITEDDILETYHRRLFDLDPAGETGSLLVAAAGRGWVDLGDGQRLGRLEPPAQWVGHSLQELQLRQRWGIQVMLVVRAEPGTSSRRVPGPDYVVEERDVLLVVGAERRLRRLASLA